jgi:hypothetical protein
MCKGKVSNEIYSQRFQISKKSEIPFASSL